jgi:hypothetical protein
MQNEREAFEANERTRLGFGPDTLTRYQEDEEQYLLPLVQARWEGWQTRAALSPKTETDKPAFYGFMSEDGTQVDVCFTPASPRVGGTLATAYYTKPQPPG